MRQALAASRAEVVRQRPRAGPPLFDLSTLTGGGGGGGGGGAASGTGAAQLNEVTVQELISMGFRDSEARVALRASKGDKDEAVARLTGDFFS